MPPPKSKRNPKAERLLREVLGERFTFPKSEGDLELLKSIYDGTYADTKPGDPSFHAYVAAVNVTSEFGGQALGFPDLIPFNNRVADIQDDYMPSYPPISPVTSAFFAGWMVLDARDDATGLTLGELFLHWEDFFRRHSPPESAAGRPLRDYLKYGNWLGYWLEFVSQAFAGYTGNMILVTGVPDEPASLPHFDPKRKL